jgi:hypothetical protein
LRNRRRSPGKGNFGRAGNAAIEAAGRSQGTDRELETALGFAVFLLVG